MLFGKHKGLSFKDLFEKHGDYARWFHNTTNEPKDGQTMNENPRDLKVYIDARLLNDGGFFEK